MAIISIQSPSHIVSEFTVAVITAFFRGVIAIPCKPTSGGYIHGPYTCPYNEVTGSYLILTLNLFSKPDFVALSVNSSPLMPKSVYVACCPDDNVLYVTGFPLNFTLSCCTSHTNFPFVLPSGFFANNPIPKSFCAMFDCIIGVVVLILYIFKFLFNPPPSFP